jgi:hypothetical protein
VGEAPSPESEASIWRSGWDRAKPGLRFKELIALALSGAIGLVISKSFQASTGILALVTALSAVSGAVLVGLGSFFWEVAAEPTRRLTARVKVLETAVASSTYSTDPELVIETGNNWPWDDKRYAPTKTGVDYKSNAQRLQEMVEALGSSPSSPSYVDYPIEGFSKKLRITNNGAVLAKGCRVQVTSLSAIIELEWDARGGMLCRASLRRIPGRSGVHPNQGVR